MAISLSYLSTVSNSGSSSTYTFSSQTLGVATSDRIIIVGGGVKKAGGAVTISNVTVAGVSPTWILKTGTGDSTTSFLALFEVPTGTTGDIVVTTTGDTPDRCRIGWYRVTGLTETTPHDTDTDVQDSVTTVSGSINIPANGFSVGFAINGATPTTDTWSGLSEDYGATTEIRYTGASLESASGEDALAVQCVFNATGDKVQLIVASWGNPDSSELFGWW